MGVEDNGPDVDAGITPNSCRTHHGNVPFDILGPEGGTDRRSAGRVGLGPRVRVETWHITTVLNTR
jgi:hypothetical protein